MAQASAEPAVRPHEHPTPAEVECTSLLLEDRFFRGHFLQLPLQLGDLLLQLGSFLLLGLQSLLLPAEPLSDEAVLFLNALDLSFQRVALPVVCVAPVAKLVSLDALAHLRRQDRFNDSWLLQEFGSSFLRPVRPGLLELPGVRRCALLRVRHPGKGVAEVCCVPKMAADSAEYGV